MIGHKLKNTMELQIDDTVKHTSVYEETALYNAEQLASFFIAIANSLRVNGFMTATVITAMKDAIFELTQDAEITVGDTKNEE